MASIISIGVSFLVFFITLGFMWLIGVHLLATIFEIVDGQVATTVARSGDESWLTTKDDLKNNIQLVMLWAVPILLLFASIKLLASAGGQGRE